MRRDNSGRMQFGKPLIGKKKEAERKDKRGAYARLCFGQEWTREGERERERREKNGDLFVSAPRPNVNLRAWRRRREIFRE